jgi:hypothetical protein
VVIFYSNNRKLIDPVSLVSFKSSCTLAGRVAQVIGHLPSKCEAPPSNSSATKKKVPKLFFAFSTGVCVCVCVCVCAG